MFQSQRSFKVLFFSFDKDIKSDDESKWLGATHAIKKSQADQQNRQLEQQKKVDKKRDEEEVKHAQTSKDVVESLKLIRAMAKENQELKEKISKLGQNWIESEPVEPAQSFKAPSGSLRRPSKIENVPQINVPSEEDPFAQAPLSARSSGYGKVLRQTTKGPDVKLADHDQGWKFWTDIFP